jgi:hypothetical protein
LTAPGYAVHLVPGRVAQDGQVALRKPGAIAHRRGVAAAAAINADIGPVNG